MFEPNMIIIRTKSTPNPTVKKGELYLVSDRKAGSDNINIKDIYDDSDEILGSSLGWKSERFRGATPEEISSVMAGFSRTDFLNAHPAFTNGWSWDEKKNTAIFKKVKPVPQPKPKVEWFVEWEIGGSHAMLLHKTRQAARTCKKSLTGHFKGVITGKVVTQLNGKRELIKCPL